MASKFHGNNKKNKLLLDQYVSYVTPHLYAAFCLTLYDKYKWDPDQIAECIMATEELWVRSADEHWDIKENCYEVTGLDVRHFKQTGQITYNGGEQNEIDN